MAKPLVDQVVVVSGSFRDYNHVLPSDTIKYIVESLGGSFSAKVNDDCTHLITTKAAHPAGTKNKQAIALGNDIKIVSLEWLTDSRDKGQLMDDTPYSLALPPAGKPSVDGTGPRRSGRATQSQSQSQSQSQPVSQPQSQSGPQSQPATANSKSKRVPKNKKDDDEDDDADKPPAKKKKANVADTKTKAKGNTTTKATKDTKGSKDAKDTKDAKADDKASVNIPVDDLVPGKDGYKVCLDKGVAFDAALNRTDAGANNNKFYIIQLLEGPAPGQFSTWTRWGRVGKKGQTAHLKASNFDQALNTFDKKFKDKSGLAWSNRNASPRNNKYTYVERTYEDDADEEPKKKKAKEDKPKKEVKKADCTLHEAVQRLVAMIFNHDFFNAAMREMSYDAKELPLGKLSKRTLLQGFEALKQLDTLVHDAAKRASNQWKIEQLSNQYFSIIPHAFGRNRPPILRMAQQIKKEVDLLEALSDMEISSKIMSASEEEDDDPVHILDRQFMGLGLDEMTPLDPTSIEYTELATYLNRSHGATHSITYNLQNIFRIERTGEAERYDKSPYANLPNTNRRLLWHGSRTTNYGGILSQGLRIAPPEAPVTGYMFGKGVYFADVSSKSANYCYHSLSNNIGLLMLCDVELGDPMHELMGSDYNAADAVKKANKLATLGLGQSIPSGWKDAGCVHKDLAGVMMPDCSNPLGRNDTNGVWLQYNEYIVYDVAQIRIKYLLEVKMR
ncbi:putative NAD(+) ADP-ribosyltransferase [Microsporum ferrugineum]